VSTAGYVDIRLARARGARRDGAVALLAAAALALAGCEALVRPAPPPLPTQVTPFSIAVPGGAFPGGWHVEAASKFRTPSEYRLVDDAGTTVVEGIAQGSASGLVEFLDVDPYERPILAWRWKMLEPARGADTTQRRGDDAPLRILLSFAGDVKSLPLTERIFFQQVRLVSGIAVPYATLEYVWGAGAPAETVVVNSYTTRIRTVVIRGEADPLGQWLSERRDVLEDFRRVFEEEPGRITAIAVYTDADATGASSRGYYGDIAFLTRSEAATEHRLGEPPPSAEAAPGPASQP
jgi:hypothetical protein